jgi:hypothetical protein
VARLGVGRAAPIGERVSRRDRRPSRRLYRGRGQTKSGDGQTSDCPAVRTAGADIDFAPLPRRKVSAVVPAVGPRRALTFSPAPMAPVTLGVLTVAPRLSGTYVLAGDDSSRRTRISRNLLVASTIRWAFTCSTLPAISRNVSKTSFE